MSGDGARETADAVGAGARRAVDVAAETPARISRADPELCAFLDVWGEEALRRAAEVGCASPAPEPVALARETAGRLVSADVVRLARPAVRPSLIDPGPAWLTLRTPGSDAAYAHRVRAADDARLHGLFGHTVLLLTPTAPTAPHGHDGPGDACSTVLNRLPRSPARGSGETTSPPRPPSPARPW